MDWRVKTMEQLSLFVLPYYLSFSGILRVLFSISFIIDIFSSRSFKRNGRDSFLSVVFVIIHAIYLHLNLCVVLSFLIFFFPNPSCSSVHVLSSSLSLFFFYLHPRFFSPFFPPNPSTYLSMNISTYLQI